MLKGQVITIDDEFEKGDSPKLTKEEAAEWLNLRIMNRAKDCIRYHDKDKKPTLDYVTNKIYAGLVEDWVYNETVLNAMRAVEADRSYVMGVIESMFDEDGEPLDIGENETMGKESIQPVAQTYPDDGRAYPYYTASLTTIDEEFDELEKAYIGHKKLSAELGKKGARTPEALASWIGRRKYGEKKYQEATAKHKKMKKVKPKKHIEGAKEYAKKAKK